MRRRRKPRVPEVLWRLFHNRARTLADTISALTPPSLATAAECWCHGRRCLSCAGDEAMSFMLRPDDPSDYRKLLTQCFVVVSQNAPPLRVLDPHCRWSQREIVKRSIEMILYELPSSSNLICCNYDKVKCSSATIDILTSSAWILLLARVGDALIMYLLMHTSIFLSLTQKRHHQITGFPVSDLNLKLSSHMHCSESQNQSMTNQRLGKKRKRLEEVNSMPGNQLCQHCPDVKPSSETVKFDDNNDYCFLKEEKLSCEKSNGSPKPNIAPPRKHTRLYRWQRLRKQRLAIASCMPCKEDINNENSISQRLHNGFSTSMGYGDESNKQQCFCCLEFRKLPKLAKSAEIGRWNMFYRLENSPSMFPKMHILNRLKSNNLGATALFMNIFGNHGTDKCSHQMQCCHIKSSGVIQPDCLYHSLLKKLKLLIRKTRSCRYLKLLDKHCSITSSFESDSKGIVCEIQENNSVEEIAVSGCCEAQIEGKIVHNHNGTVSKIALEATLDPLGPSNSYCLKKQVVSFIWATCRSLVPTELLGSPSNWRVLRKNIAKFIQLRKFEKFSLKQCLHKLKISKFPLLSRKYFCSFGGMEGNQGPLGNNHYECNAFAAITDSARHAIFECWIFWFFAHLVSPLVQANFYVTESEHEKQEVLYFRKSTWEKQLREAEKCLKDHSYQQLNHASTLEILRKRSFGFSRIRLRPKQKGFRVLANLQAPSRIHLGPLSKIHLNQNLQRKTSYKLTNVRYESFKSVNSVLHDLHVVLKGIQTQEPEKLGSSVFDYNDVHRKLVDFLLHLKNGSATFPRVFIVVSDVSKAFDSVDQDKLCSVMSDVVLYDEFMLEKYIQVICPKKSLKICQNLVLSRQDVAETNKFTVGIPAHSLNSVLVKKAFSKIIRKEQFNMVLNEHIKQNVVQLGNNFYLQNVGIPQGSVLSSLLCSFYYGHMERNILYPFLEKALVDKLGETDKSVSTSSGCRADETCFPNSEYLLLRFVDDFLFISTSKKQASMFFSRLERGVHEYNCRMNVEKYGLNFDMKHSQGLSSSRLYIGKDGISFLRWSGLLVNCHTLEIQADYTRYMNSRLSSALTVSCQGKVGRKLKAKLCDYLRPKCHPLFFDSNINSRPVVRLNIYQIFLLCAMKFLCYVSSMTTVPRFSPNFYIASIKASLRYMHRFIKKRMYAFHANFALRPKYAVKKKEIIWLGLHAYSRVVGKKQSCYKKLLHSLKFELKARENVGNSSSDLRFAVDDSHSSALWSIKF